MILKGILVTGFGEGSYYMSKDRYKKGFKEKLGYEPWPGTLNIKVESIINLRDLNPIMIKGFKENEREFGDIKCYPCSILGKENIVLHLVVPKINKHEKNIIELISPNDLRKTLDLKDGDSISIKLV